MVDEMWSKWVKCWSVSARVNEGKKECIKWGQIGIEIESRLGYKWGRKGDAIGPTPAPAPAPQFLTPSHTFLQTPPSSIVRLTN